jgi:hypothetical protein
VTIRATTASGAWEEVTIAIVQAPTPQPAPGVRGMKVRGTARLYGIRVRAHDGVLLIRLRSRRAGVLRVRALHRHKLVGRCRARTPARRVLTCRVRLHRIDPSRVRLVISLRVQGRLLDVRRVSLRHLRHRMS